MRRLLPALVFVVLSAQAFAQETFSNIQLTVQEGEKTKRIDVTVEFAGNAMIVRDKKTKEVRRTLPYDQIKTAEYSYATPRGGRRRSSFRPCSCSPPASSTGSW
jgi:hypothetical protein